MHVKPMLNLLHHRLLDIWWIPNYYHPFQAIENLVHAWQDNTLDSEGILSKEDFVVGDAAGFQNDILSAIRFLQVTTRFTSGPGLSFKLASSKPKKSSYWNLISPIAEDPNQPCPIAVSNPGSWRYYTYGWLLGPLIWDSKGVTTSSYGEILLPNFTG